MILQIYTIQDLKVGTHQVPFFSHTDETAKRLVLAESMNHDSMLAKFPADYVLYRHGTYDDIGMFFVADPMVAVCNVIDLLNGVDTDAEISNDTSVFPRTTGGNSEEFV